MAVDVERALALELPSFEVTVERGRLRFFAQSIGETDPIYIDVDAARAVGHPDLPVPPTFMFSLSLEAPAPFGYLEELGVDLRTVLHGEQRFDYATLSFAGDTLALSERIAEVTSKRGGAMEFLTKETVITRGNEYIARATSVVVVRNSVVSA
ncbi:MaoC family dehydratase N-terminal domain-containing protein [Acrocarpospora catenulata]|uniref:MaoC family dehydratase N-terminal domain-containing protein n=1 Tax=Acrocarpospora catenulata TaxID=2836182 RepID=UPI001BDA22F0|nr:MaoC family dehydratase N-terminal domain-containing protein [Acrocarpospora catenulata]